MVWRAVIWALIVSVLVWTPSGKLTAAQEVYSYPSQSTCVSAAKLIESTVKDNQPAAKVVFECVAMQKPIST